MSDERRSTTAELIQAGVLEIGDGYRAKNAEFEGNGGLPFVRVGNVSLSGLNVDGLDELPERERAKYEPKVSKPGDSLITMKGTVGRVAFVDELVRPFVYSPQISYWRSHDPEAVDPRWLRYWLEGPEFAWQAAATKGSTDMADYVNLRDQRKMTITLPEVSVQQQVAEVLGSIDDLIENNRRRVEVLEEMARAIYREWFVHFRYPGHESVPLVDSPLGPIPEGWTQSRLGDVVAVNRSSRKPAEGEIVRYLDISCLGDRAVEMPPEVDGSDAPGRARRVVSAGDVVWSMVRPNRRAHAQLVEPGSDWIASTGLAVLTPEKISSSLLFELASSLTFSDHLVSQATGAAYPAVKPKDFEAVCVLIPPPDLDQRFSQVAEPLHRQTWILWETKRRLTSLRDLLLPKLVTGQIDVSSLDLDSLMEGSVG